MKEIAIVMTVVFPEKRQKEVEIINNLLIVNNPGDNESGW